MSLVRGSLPAILELFVGVAFRGQEMSRLNKAKEPEAVSSVLLSRFLVSWFLVVKFLFYLSGADLFLSGSFFASHTLAHLSSLAFMKQKFCQVLHSFSQHTHVPRIHPLQIAGQ